ncbi:MAG: DUF3857 domain-containing protein [Verrucomicrobiales bacterium]|nr:DUF3857 domain-containing protein [Verrucomicrobiales bacterium]
MFRLFLLFSLSTGLTSPVFAQETLFPLERPNPALQIAPIPEWVVPIQPDLNSPGPSREGEPSDSIFYRLVDVQKQIETAAAFYHYADEILTTAGVHDDSEIRIEYDPAYETLDLHHVTIHRDGRTIDGLEHALIREIQPEEEFDSNMLYGHWELLIMPAGIRSGDVIDYAYTITGRNPYYDGRFFDIFDINWEKPVLHTRYRLLKSPDRPLFFKNHRTELTPRRNQLESGLEELVWEAKNVPAVRPEPDTPAWFDPFSFVELSEFNTWQEVAALGHRKYDFSDEPDSPELTALEKRIQAAHPEDETAQVTAAIRFVQDEIRYLGIEEGPRAFTPVSPATTLRRRFGDCKDKTVLLRQILEKLGIRSTPMYVEIDESTILRNRQPSPIVFDHVILLIQLESGRKIYCDCTQTHVGSPADSLHLPDYHVGLKLDESGDGLIEIPSPSPEKNRTETITKIFPGGIGEPARMEVVTRYFGTDANAQRYFAQSDSAESARLDFLDYYREDYGAVASVHPPKIEDDREANRFQITETYDLHIPWEEDESDPGWYSLSVYLAEVRNELARPAHPFRTAPFAFNHPKSIRQEIHLQLDRPNEWDFEDERHFVESPAFTLRREVTYDAKKGLLRIAADYQSTADYVPSEKMVEHVEQVDFAYELTRYQIWNLDQERGKESIPDGGDVDYAREFAPIEFPWALAIGVSLLLVFFGLGIGVILTVVIVRLRRAKNEPTGSV